MYLVVDPSKVICSVLTLAKLLVLVLDLLNPAICINEFAAGAELNLTISVFALILD